MLVVLFLLVCLGCGQAQFQTSSNCQVSTIQNTNNRAFGSSLAISSNGFIAVGWPQQTGITAPQSGFAGEVVIYQLDECCTPSEDPLEPTDAAVFNEYFGSAVAFDRNFLFVGSNHSQPDITNQGAVYVYECLEGENCTFITELFAANSTGGDLFGVSINNEMGTPIAVSLPLLIVGAPGNAGGAYVFVCNSNPTMECIQASKLLSPGQEYGSNFGQLVALSDAYVAVSSASYQFAVLYDCNYPTNCIVGTPLDVTPPPYSLALSKTSDGGLLLALGQPSAIISHTSYGQVTVFQCSSITTCSASTFSPESNYHFGYNVALSGSLLVVSASGISQYSNSQFFWYNCSIVSNCSVLHSCSSGYQISSLSMAISSSTTIWGNSNPFSSSSVNIYSPCDSGIFGEFCEYNCTTDCPASNSCVYGVCLCSGNWVGTQCDNCPSGFFVNSTTGDCEQCLCDVFKSTSFICDANTGQCPCLATATSQHCDQCTFFGQTGEMCNDCKSGYYGSNCSQCPICQNGGSCADGASGNGTCVCQPGTFGALCENVNCIYQGCQNQGKCQTNGVCNCNGLNYTGTYCQTFQVSCLNQPCQNGGQCQELFDEATNTYNYTCSCVAGFEGAYCANATGCLNLDQQCLNGGTCALDSNSNTYECNCAAGFEGTNCANATGCLNLNQQCLNGGTCVLNSNSNTYECSCAAGFEGANCADATGCLNSDQQCLNGGTCVLASNSSTYQCSCVAGFSGTNCSDAAGCRTDALSCLNNGTCTPTGDNNGVQCVCSSNFTGTRCDQAVTTTTTQNLGVTVDSSDTYWLLAAVGGCLTLIDIGFVIYFRQRVIDPETRTRFLFIALVRLPMFFFDVFDTVADAFFLLVVHELMLIQPSQDTIVFYTAIAFTVLPYLVNLLAACFIGFRQALRAPDASEASKWFAMAILVFLSGDMLDSLRLMISLDELRLLHAGQKLEKDMTNNLGLLYELVFSQNHSLRALLFIWLVKVACKDLPHLVIQGYVQSQLSTENPIVILSLAATAVSAIISMISFAFLTIIPVIHHGRERKQGLKAVEMEKM